MMRIAGCWNWDYHSVRPLSEEEVAAMRNGAGRHVIYEPGTFRASAKQGQ